MKYIDSGMKYIGRIAMAKKRDYGQLLMWAAVSVGAPRWAGAMLAADVPAAVQQASTSSAYAGNVIELGLRAASVVSGLGMGLLEVLAMAYMLDALRGMKAWQERGSSRKPNMRYWGTLGFTVGILGLSPFILAPYLVSRMDGMLIGQVLGSTAAQYVWAVAVVLAPVFVVGGVAFARPGLVTVSHTDSAEGGPSQGAGSMRADAAQPIAQGTASGATAKQHAFRCEACALEFKSQQAFAAHQRWQHRKVAP